MGKECVSILPTKKAGQDNVVCVTVKDVSSGALIKLHQATLVIGADGMKSK